MDRRELLDMLGLAVVAGVPAHAQGEAQAQGRGGRGRVDPGPPITNTPQSARDKFAGIY